MPAPIREKMISFLLDRKIPLRRCIPKYDAEMARLLLFPHRREEQAYRESLESESENNLYKYVAEAILAEHQQESEALPVVAADELRTWVRLPWNTPQEVVALFLDRDPKRVTLERVDDYGAD